MNGHRLSMTIESRIDAPIDRVWQIVVGDYVNIGHWATSIPYSKPNPDLADDALGRVCSVPGFGEIKETVTQLDADARTFTYVAEGMPFFIRSIQNAWQLIPDGTQTIVRSQATGELMPILGRLMWMLMRFQMDRTARQFFEELKHYAVTGEIHPRKQKQLQRAS